LPKSCQKVAKKLPKSCQKVAKKLPKSCPNLTMLKFGTVVFKKKKNLNNSF
jgi:hypothetical protein